MGFKFEFYSDRTCTGIDINISIKRNGKKCRHYAGTRLIKFRSNLIFFLKNKWSLKLNLIFSSFEKTTGLKTKFSIIIIIPVASSMAGCIYNSVWIYWHLNENGQILFLPFENKIVRWAQTFWIFLASSPSLYLKRNFHGLINFHLKILFLDGEFTNSINCQSPDDFWFGVAFLLL